MLKLLFSFFTLLNTVVSLEVNSTLMKDYLSFIKTYGKEYNHDNFLTFKNNSKMIEIHNNENHTYKLEINQFSDKKTSFNHIIYTPKNGTYIGENTEISLPYSIDWRKKDVVSAVKNQGHCGSCWSFSATGATESIHAISTGNLLNISEQQLIDCSGSYGNQGCNGGSMDSAFKYAIDNGLCSEKEYPYTGEGGDCEECKTVVNISDYKDVVPNNEEILKRVVHQQPVSVAIQANQPSFQAYSSGVYSDPDCGTQLDHGVLIVGYGYDMFHNLDYWIVKNSWGPDWGENGYIRIQRNIDKDTGLCGIAMQPSIPIN